MLDTGKDLKSLEVGTMEDMGLGRMTPFVKLGLDAMNSSWRELEEDVETMISGFDSRLPSTASKHPPLGNFQSVGESEGATPLSPSRLSELLRGFNGLIGKSGGPNGESGFDGLRRVFGTINLLHRTFNDYRQYSDQAAGSTFSNLRM